MEISRLCVCIMSRINICMSMAWPIFDLWDQINMSSMPDILRVVKTVDVKIMHAICAHPYWWICEYDAHIIMLI